MCLERHVVSTITIGAPLWTCHASIQAACALFLPQAELHRNTTVLEVLKDQAPGCAGVTFQVRYQKKNIKNVSRQISIFS